MKKEKFIEELKKLEKNGLIEEKSFYDSYKKDYEKEIILTYCTFSDYTGTIVERSNNKYFREKYPFIKEQYGGYGTVWTTISPNELENESELYEEFLEEYKSLIDYPLIDEELYSEMEFEAQNEAWKDWVKSDFIYYLENKLEINGTLEEYIADFEEKECIDIDYDYFIIQLFEKGREKANEYWIIETGGNPYIDVEKIVECLDWKDIDGQLEHFKLLDYENNGQQRLF